MKLFSLLIIIIINSFIEGSLIIAKALFCLRALFSATGICSYTRMASLIRTRLSDLCMQREVGSFSEETIGYNCTPGWKPSYLCPIGPPTTDGPHPGASTLISAPLSKQLGHQGLFLPFCSCSSEPSFNWFRLLTRANSFESTRCFNNITDNYIMQLYIIKSNKI